MSAGTPVTETARRPRIGDRVRIRIPRGKPCERVAHCSAEGDRLGNVLRVDPTDSHPYFVVFDRPIPWPSQVLSDDEPPIPLWGRHYDADELETIEG
jgi:hypothetical protein